MIGAGKMANWLSRATDAFRKPPPAAPEPFTVRCDCGGTVTGVRVAAPQRPACPGCGRQVFVLPINAYPTVVRPKKPKAESPPAPSESAGSVGNLKASKPDRQGSQPDPAATAKSRDGILLETRGRILTPLRMIVIAISLVLAVTVWGLWYRSRIEQAKSQVAAANEAGMKALQEGSFGTAAANLTRARNAVDLLGRTDPEANAIRRNCREAIAGHELSSSGLFDLLAEFAADSRSGRSKFASRHRGAWLILDVIIASPEATERPCQIDMPILIDEMNFRIVVDSPLVRAAALREQANGPARVIFAAPMSELHTVRSDGNPEGTLVLNGKSAFLWTSFETYTALGYQESRAEDLAATKEVLARQLEQSEKTR